MVTNNNKLKDGESESESESPNLIDRTESFDPNPNPKIHC